jgi:cytochrome c oxidase cbb3-type subunit 3
MTPMKNAIEEKEELRPHSYDGIQEYDKRLPNWWLFTLYGAIAFSIGYWVFYHQWHAAYPPGIAVERELRENRMAAERASGVVNDDLIWNLSRDPKVIDAGKTTFNTNCASCHLTTLTGQIGPNLIDEYWLHGGKPLDVIKTITSGVQEKGMPTWGPILGKEKITEVAAFIFSFHRQGEPIKQAPPWIPGQPMQVSATAGN